MKNRIPTNEECLEIAKSFFNEDIEQDKLYSFYTTSCCFGECNPDEAHDCSVEAEIKLYHKFYFDLEKNPTI